MHASVSRKAAQTTGKIPARSCWRYTVAESTVWKFALKFKTGQSDLDNAARSG
jgi:hypothetical protein